MGVENSPVISGSIAVDSVVRTNHSFHEWIDVSKDRISTSFFAEEYVERPGGTGSNIAYTFSKLGGTPFLLGASGEDYLTQLAKLNELGVDTEHVHISQLPTARFHVLTDCNGSQIASFYPGAMFDSESLVLRAWAGTNTMVVVSPHDPKSMLSQINQCEQYNLRLFFDPGQQVINSDKEILRRGVEVAEVVIVNDYELELLSEKLGVHSDELQTSVPYFVTTYGEKGSVISGRKVSCPITVPVAKATQVIDVTGAGDAFRAGFLRGFLMEKPLEVAGRMGAVAGAYAVEKLGTMEHDFTHEEFADRYKKNFGENLTLS